jgi:hypothetical protein
MPPSFPERLLQFRVIGNPCQTQPERLLCRVRVRITAGDARERGTVCNDSPLEDQWTCAGAWPGIPSRQGSRCSWPAPHPPDKRSAGPPGIRSFRCSRKTGPTTGSRLNCSIGSAGICQGGSTVKGLADAALGGAFDPRQLESARTVHLGYRAKWHVLRYKMYGLDWDITALHLTPNQPTRNLTTGSPESAWRDPARSSRHGGSCRESSPAARARAGRDTVRGRACSADRERIRTDLPMTHYGHVEKPRQLAGGLVAALTWLAQR